MQLTVRLKGGLGSGHHGHAGRPGQRGGSLPGKSGAVKMANIASAKELIASQREELGNAAKFAGEHYFGEDFLWDEPRKFIAETADGRLKRLAEDMGVNYTDPEEVKYVQLVDDFEYVFTYNTATKTPKPWATYQKKEERLTTDDFKAFYKSDAKPGDFLVSYWENELSVIVP